MWANIGTRHRTDCRLTVQAGTPFHARQGSCNDYYRGYYLSSVFTSRALLDQIKMGQ